MFVNEPWLIDKTIESTTVQERMVAVQPENEDDNIRIYIPMDLNKKAILRRLQSVIY